MTRNLYDSVGKRSIKRLVNGAANDVTLACLQISDALACLPLCDYDSALGERLKAVAVSVSTASACLQEFKALIDRGCLIG